MSKLALFVAPIWMERNFEFIPEDRGFMIRSPSPLRARGSLSRRPIGS